MSLQKSCGLCLESCKIDLIFDLPCTHKVCYHCLAHFLQTNLTKEDLRVEELEEIICPVSENCTESSDISAFEDVIPPFLFKKLTTFAATHKQKKKIKAKENECPNCSYSPLIFEDDVPMGQCEECDYCFCIKCRKDFHGFEECGMTASGSTSTSPPLTPHRPSEASSSSSKILPKSASLSTERQSSMDEETLKLICELTFEDEMRQNAPRTIELNCCVCLNEVDINKIVDFGCEHMSCCRSCGSDFFESQIQSGDIKGLKCPEAGCKQEASQALIQELVDPLIFDRLNELQFNIAVQDMPEIVKCPKPDCMRYLHADPEYGYCDDCDYRFCTECNQSYHGTTPCGMSDEELRAYMARYAAADEAERLRMENEAKSKRKKENEDSEHLIRSIYKRCPTCNTDIEKIMGCNRMDCTKCNTSFCWLCGVRIIAKDPYDHFQNSQCGLFEIPPDT